MYLNEPLLKAVSAGSAGRFLKEGESLRSQPLGELYLPTGKIVANDPCCLFEGTPFTRTVPPGSYPVNLWVWEGGIFSALDDALEKSYVDTYSAANVRLPDSEYNVAAFSSGWGDGGYPSYWGFDAEGQLCCLMTDFCILDL